MKKFKILGFAFFNMLIILLFLCCKKNDIINFNAEKTSDSITVKLFNNDSANQPVLFKNGTRFTNDNPKILVVYKDSIEGKIPFEDTFNLKLISNETFIYLNYGFDKTEYYFPQKGDILNVTYKKGVPIIQVKNHPEWEYNVTEYINSKIKKPESYLEYLINNQNTDRKNDGKASREDIENYYKKYVNILDSLYSKKKLNQSYFTNVKKIKEIELYNTLLTEVGSFKKEDQYAITHFLKSDSILKFPIFREFIKSYSDYHHQIFYVGKTNSQKKESVKGFDSVLKSQEYSPKIKNYLLFFYLEDIIKHYPSSVSEAYLRKFGMIKGNDISQYQSIIKRKYLFDKNSNQIILKSVHNQTKSLDGIIKENKGKIIYMDFWASWCLPCRKAMPSSKKLRLEFEGKDIVFVYLSIDKDFDQWKTANTKEDLDFYKNSYIIVNQENSIDFKKLGIQTIPRYLIYDKKGKLTYPNAPSPESQEIKKEINLLLR